MTRTGFAGFFGLLGALLLAGSATAGGAALSAEQAQAIVEAADRDAADRERDGRRHPAEFLVFSTARPGARVADLGAGSGYTTELLVRAVGDEGVVYGHNTPSTIEKYVSESWPARLAKPVNQKVIRVDREFQEPLPPEATDLDVVTMIYVYHDTPLYGVDRAALLKTLHGALTPGGVVVVVDHHAVAGAPVKEAAESVHRIDEAVVRSDFESAGFTLDASGDFMRNPEDPRDKAFFQMEGPTDTFVHRWKKPAD